MSKLSQTTLSIDKETREMASAKAEENGMSVSVVARILLRDYAAGKLDIGSRSVERDENGFTAAASLKLDKTMEDINSNKNLSPTFENADDAVSWLHKQTE